MKKLTYLRLVLLLLPLLSQAQAPGELPGASNTLGCASTTVMQSKPSLLLKQQQLEDFLLANPTPIAAGKPQPLPLVLPLVVHIIHQNGVENISDAQVFAAVEHLNQAFAHEGYYAQQGDGANTQIQFCLARRTPDGQLSNGITRTESALTNMVIETEDQALKDLSRWDPKDYVNIWVVKAISSQSSGPGVAGYAYLASAHGEPYDGLVCEAQFFGSNPAEDAVFIHEIGHYLNLYHTFEGGCPNTSCQVSGDHVCDTPPDRATHTNCLFNSCHTDADDTSPNNPFTIDVDDATENFMDYSPFPCYRTFTTGQGERMRLAIENLRSSLLSSLGCKDPCPAPITVAYSVAATEIATGEMVVFTNQSTLATNYEWYVNGNLESISTNFNFQFLSEGQFEVVLKAFNADPNCVGIAKDTIIVKCGAIAAFSVNASELTVGEMLHCTNNSVGATSYEWAINGFPLGVSIDLDYTFNSPGFYTVTLQAINEFCNTSASKSVYVYSNAPSCDSVLGRHYAYDTPPSYNYFLTPAYNPDGSLYVYSYNYPKGVVTRFDPQGNKLWQNAVNVPYNGVEDICTMEDGGAIFANDYKHTVIKMNADGTIAWSKSVTLPSATVEFNSINLGDGALMYAGGVEVNGPTLLYYLYLYKFLSDGTLAWSHKYKFDVDVEFTWENTAKNDNGFWIPGFTSVGYTHTGGLIMRFDNDGNILFSKHYKLEDDDEVAIFAVSVNNNNECVASGAEKLALGGNDAKQFLFKVNPTGAPVWARKFVPVLNYPYGDLQKVITRPTGGYLQMLDFAFTSRKWAAWSETGNLEFVEEITEPGFLADILQYNGLMTGFFKKDHNAIDCYLQNLAPDGKPNLCSALNISDRQNVGFNMVASDLQYTEVPYTPVIEPIILTTSPFPPFNQVPFCTTPSQCIEFCNNGLDDDKDGYVDCFDPDCACFDADTTCTLANTQQKIPDANIAVDSSRCRTDSFELYLNICNLGSAVLPGGTPIAFYDGDPTASASVLLFAPVIMQDSIAKGTCHTVKLDIPATYNTSIFMVINDDGSLPRPFNLTTNFPSTAQPECQYGNNMASFSIQNQTPTLDLGPDISLCKNSVIQLTANPNFQKFRWQDGSDQSSFTAFLPGKYWVDVYDACGFWQSDTVNIVLDSIATLELPEEAAFCAGESLNLSADGFSNYSWSPASVVNCADCASVEVVADQSVTLMLTASAGECFVTDSIRIWVNPVPVPDLQVENGDCDTPARIGSNLELSSFGFNWSNGSTENVVFPIQSGTYTVTITSPEGCSIVNSAAVTLLEPDLSISFQTIPIPCTGGPGLITANAQGGSGQYDFAWSTGDSTQTISVLLPGWYSLTLTDLNGTGCMAIDSVEVEASGSIALETSSVQISCFGAKDGAAQAFPLEGTAPFTWLWSTGQTSSSINGLAAGIYSVTVSDALACTGVVSLEIIEPGWILVAAQALDFKLCPNETTTINTMIAGGTPPYTFLWSNGLTDSILTGANAGNYMLTVTDQNHCIGISVVEIEAVPMMVLLLDSVDHASGPTQADGQVFVQISGGVSPVNFLWSNGATTKNLQAVVPGIYTLTVTDAAGCTQSLSATVDYVLSAGEQWALTKGWNAKIRPNPSQAADAAQLILESNQAQIFEIQLFDAIGRVLWQRNAESKSGGIQIQLPTPAAAGLYWIRVSNGLELKSLKWVITD